MSTTPSDPAAAFVRAVESTDDLAEPALVMARLERASLDPAPYLARLDEMARVVRERLTHLPAAMRATPTGHSRASIGIVSHYLFDELGFGGSHDSFDDPRGSFLNEVLERKVGIPIILGVLFLEVARRAGLRADGVNFPGHFLVSCPVDMAGAGDTGALIVDPFNGGSVLDDRRCRELLQETFGDDVPYHPALLLPASRRQILVRMLLNLKRVYVLMRSFPQARTAIEMLLAINPSALTELRDRGLLAYHLKDFPAALHDLQTYARLVKVEDTDESREERDQIWEHIKTLRRRVAGLN